MKNILYLINPRANDGNSIRLWRRARRTHPFLPESPVDVTSVNIRDLLMKERPEIIAIAGGDGTINAVCQAVSSMSHKPLLAVLPFGFGNALAYCLGVETIDKAVNVLKKPIRKVTIDLMRTSVKGHETGVFNISAGFDAKIVLNKQYFRYIGIGAYILSALHSLVTHPTRDITFTIDHRVTLNAKASSLVIANCPIIGQNYVVAPNAKLNDGFLDCTLFSTKYTYLRNIRLRGFKHPLYTDFGKVRFKAKHIRIEGEPFVQIDGDPVIRREPIEIGIRPSQLTFLRNKEENIDQIYLPFIS